MFREISALLKKEILLEWRQRHALNGILLYVSGTICVCYLSFSLKKGSLNPASWNALFWVILLFTAVNAVAKSFLQEKEGRFIYYYSLVSPEAVILSKIIYNAGLLSLVSFLAYFFYSVVLGNPVQDEPLFVGNMLLGAVGFASSLTMVSGIAAKASNSYTLMTVLSFPVVIPMLMLLVKVANGAVEGLARSTVSDELVTIAAINAIVLAVSYLLFPYLWRS